MNMSPTTVEYKPSEIIYLLNSFNTNSGLKVSYFFLLFPTFWGLSYFFLLLGQIPTFSYFFRILPKLSSKNTIFERKIFLALLCLA